MSHGQEFWILRPLDDLSWNHGGLSIGANFEVVDSVILECNSISPLRSREKEFASLSGSNSISKPDFVATVVLTTSKLSEVFLRNSDLGPQTSSWIEDGCGMEIGIEGGWIEDGWIEDGIEDGWKEDGCRVEVGIEGGWIEDGWIEDGCRLEGDFKIDFWGCEGSEGGRVGAGGSVGRGKSG